MASRERWLVREIVAVPHDECRVRRPDYIAWPGEYVSRGLDQAEVEDLCLIFIHSHPGGYFAFSDVDDESDMEVVKLALANHGQAHGSAIMIPTGAVKARCYDERMKPTPFELVSVVGDDIQYWWDDFPEAAVSNARPMAFTDAMARELARLSAIVVGVSGTGSIVAEQLNRMGVGRVEHLDFDVIEDKNLNRVLNSTREDAKARRLKVDMFVEAAKRYRKSGSANALASSILSREAVILASTCDVVFSCVDTLEARQVLDLVSATYLVPLVDVGVVIPTRAAGGGRAIADVCGRVDYVKPGGASLGDRGVYSPESLRAEYLAKNAPEAHRQELDAGYIKGSAEEAPSVISLNMRAASTCVNEFIARAYPFRHEGNASYARTQFSLAACEEEYTSESQLPRRSFPRQLGAGSREPLLGLPALSPPEESGR
jgi:hypothetical protein